MGKVITDEEREKRMAEDIWLNYFNRYLYESNTISEKEYKRMTERLPQEKQNAIRKGTQGERVHLGVLKALPIHKDLLKILFDKFRFLYCNMRSIMV